MLQSIDERGTQEETNQSPSTDMDQMYEQTIPENELQVNENVAYEMVAQNRLPVLQSIDERGTQQETSLSPTTDMNQVYENYLEMIPENELQVNENVAYEMVAQNRLPVLQSIDERGTQQETSLSPSTDMNQVYENYLEMIPENELQVNENVAYGMVAQNYPQQDYI